jgi:ankyrin repeat protein
MLLPTEHPLAVDAARLIRTGDVDGLRALLAENPEVATARFGDDTTSRSALHAVTDWPGHLPGGAAMVQVLVEAGADVNARFVGAHTETPLHWAASCDDVEVLDALLDAGADIEAQGAVIAGGTPLFDARAFGQWKAAFRLVERGAQVTPADAATLGLIDRVREFLTTEPPAEEVNRLLWGACHGGRFDTAVLLLDHGADVDWIPDWERLTPLDAAAREGATDLVTELRRRGGHTVAELDDC